MASHPEKSPTIFDRMKIFDRPFVYMVMNTNVDKFCTYCMRKPKEGSDTLKKCGGCEFSRYCSKDCQRMGWKDHKLECARLKKVFPNLPLTEVLFLSRVLDKVEFLAKRGDKYGWEKDRKFSDLMDHKDDIKKDPLKYAHFEKIYDRMQKFRSDSPPNKDVLFNAFCKTSINSHCVHTSAGTEIGMALDLAVSKYDHSCRPNCTLVFDGFIACLRPLTPETNAADFKTSFISYTDVGRSRYQRRKDLLAKWYFRCQCTRCRDPNDDILTAIKCASNECNEPILITEECEPMYIACPKCKNVIDQVTVETAQQFMKNLPARFSFEGSEENAKQPVPIQVKNLLDHAERILHKRNIYYCRLQTAYLQMVGDLDSTMFDPEMQKQVYENYKACFPKADRHIGYQLLHLVKSLIERQRRQEAIPYAYEAMTIFEICFGLEHPYYLQTLALWTYLDKQPEKSDKELLKLLNFNYNQPVDIGKYLKKLDSGAIESASQNGHQNNVPSNDDVRQPAQTVQNGNAVKQ